MQLLYQENLDLNFNYYEIDDLSADVPMEFSIKQNFPNPFNHLTLIDFDLYQNDHIKIAIYDIKGRLINILSNKYYLEGKYFVKWEGKNYNGEEVPSGIYIYQISTSKKTLSKKMTLLR